MGFFRNFSIAFWFLFLIVSCSDDSGDTPEPQPETDRRQADLVIDGSPWTFDQYVLLNVLERNGSALTDQEIADLGAAAYGEVVLTFNANGSGTETGFDPIPSNFFWDLDSSGNVIFLDNAGNALEPPLGSFHVNLSQQRVSFTAERTEEDPQTTMEIRYSGRADFTGEF